jgi:hypothetical protein
MKAEFDKEIDSLLRESARRGRAASAAHAAHLDADEQSAYAENALPAAARTHYAAHLADCDDCLRSVTQLALAAGMPAQLEPRETATGQTISPNITWRERFGALFAPRAWRYAVPALALLLVGVVSLVVLTRKPREEASIAQRNAQETQRQETPRATAPQPEAHHAPQDGTVAPATTASSGAESAGIAPNSNASPQNASPAKEEIAANRPPAEVAQPLAGTAVNNDAAPPPPAPSSGTDTSTRAITVLPTPAPVADGVTIRSDQAAKSKSGEAAPELARIEQKPNADNRQYDNRQYENRRREQISGPRRSNNEQARNTRTAESDDSPNRADKKDGSPAASAPAAPSAMAAKRSRRGEAERNRDESRSAEDSETRDGARTGFIAETRTVAGRKFHRQGSAWVDTAYNAGQSYTVVRRNSEQFRALVADEPELRRIASALGGEVTVVWKGRAYRIR